MLDTSQGKRMSTLQVEAKRGEYMVAYYKAQKANLLKLKDKPYAPAGVWDECYKVRDELLSLKKEFEKEYS